MDRTIQSLLNSNCPIIFPFDVKQGDPQNNLGKSAHYTVILGIIRPNNKRSYIHYHQGKFRYSPVNAMLQSNLNLTGNYKTFYDKYEIKLLKGGNDKVGREYLKESNVRNIKNTIDPETKDLKQPKKLYRVRRVKKSNTPSIEYCRPKLIKNISQDIKELMSSQGYDPDNLDEAGLYGNLVAVYPTAVHNRIRVV